MKILLHIEKSTIEVLLTFTYLVPHLIVTTIL